MAQGGHGLGEQERSKTNESRGDCSVHEQYSSICHSSLEMVPTERLALSRGTGRQFTKLPLSLLKPHRRNGGPPRICTVFHPGKSRSFTIKVCDPRRDAKAELNRRSQACDVLTGTGISRRVKEIPSAPNPASGHYFDRARPLPAGRIHLGNGRA